MHRKFEKLLHEYKLEVFHADHDKQSCDEIAAECLQVTDEVLKQKYRYHFHQLPDANRAEIINMISNYTREALLPPVVEKIVERQLHMERRMDAIVHLTTAILEALSEPSSEQAVKG
ncbi:MAG: hypothetical protein CMK00_01855 [Planctomycetes bacterium]|nr:hypothetical protein [Planctomycetota bacterium]HJO26974.1 hypothetical protein [Planctomycetota bacterium]